MCSEKVQVIYSLAVHNNNILLFLRFKRNVCYFFWKVVDFFLLNQKKTLSLVLLRTFAKLPSFLGRKKVYKKTRLFDKKKLDDTFSLFNQDNAWNISIIGSDEIPRKIKRMNEKKDLAKYEVSKHLIFCSSLWSSLN